MRFIGLGVGRRLGVEWCQTGLVGRYRPVRRVDLRLDAVAVALSLLMTSSSYGNLEPKELPSQSADDLNGPRHLVVPANSQTISGDFDIRINAIALKAAPL